MILKLTDDKEFYVTDSQAAQIQQSVADGKEFILLPNSVMIKTKMIFSLLPGADPVAVIKETHRIEDKRVATEEGIRAAREKLMARIKKAHEAKER